MDLPHHIFPICGMILSASKDILTFIKRMIKQALPENMLKKKNNKKNLSSCIFLKHIPGHHFVGQGGGRWEVGDNMDRDEKNI